MIFLLLLFILPLLLSASLSTTTSELTTLMAMKASLDPQNQVLTSWTDTASSDPCDSSFEGIACNELGHVANISLQGKGLRGRIPSALAGLKDLTGLYLHFNALTGEIPREIGNLSKLIDLYLNVNNLTGGIPPEIGAMSNLEGMFVPSISVFFLFLITINLQSWRFEDWRNVDPVSCMKRRGDYLF